MASNQTFNNPQGADEVIKKPRPGPRSWQVTLVQIRRRDAAHRLTQVYQLLLQLQWPQTSRELDPFTATPPTTTLKVIKP